MLALTIAVPVVIANAVLLIFFVPYAGAGSGMPGPAWMMLFGQTGILVAGTVIFFCHKPAVRTGTLWLAFLGCLLSNPLIWLALLHGWDADRVFRPAAILIQFLLFGAAGLYQFVHRPEKGRCAQCNYDLTANVSGRCPECGTLIPGATAETKPPRPTNDAKP